MTGGWLVAFILLALATALLSVLFLALLRYVAGLSTRLPQPIPLELSQGPEVGSELGSEPLPAEFASIALGEPLGLRTLLVFVSTSCATCYSLLTDLDRFARDTDCDEVAVVLSGSNAEHLLKTFPRLHWFIDSNGGVGRSLGISTVPFALMYERGSLKAKGVVNNREMLEALSLGYSRKGGDELIAAFDGISS